MAFRPPAPWHAPDASRRRRRRRHEPSVRDAIAALATRQAGVVARWQLLAARIESNTIDRLIRSGHLRTVHDGVYAVGQRSLDPVARYWASVLACGPQALLGGWSAVAHIGVVGRRSRARVDVVVPPGHKPAPHGVAVRRLVLHRRERTTVRGLACVSGIRAVLDVGVTSGANDAERVWRGPFMRGASTSTRPPRSSSGITASGGSASCALSTTAG